MKELAKAQRLWAVRSAWADMGKVKERGTRFTGMRRSKLTVWRNVARSR